MAKVTGIGGVFFRSSDPASLAAWYHEHLGINPTPTTVEEQVWMQDGGATVFAPFPKDTDYFGPVSNQFMVNFRVDDIEGMVTELRGKGVEITHREEMPGIGLFAHLFDPEGNKIELWEPAPPA